jgi:hypothetical protein
MPTSHFLKRSSAQALKALKAVMYLANGVVPDPVPMAAAIGITLDCWRNTELETAHTGSKTLSDMVMAKLNIATTRAVRAYITTGRHRLERRRGSPSRCRATNLAGPHHRRSGWW